MPPYVLGILYGGAMLWLWLKRGKWLEEKRIFKKVGGWVLDYPRSVPSCLDYVDVLLLES